MTQSVSRTVRGTIIKGVGGLYTVISDKGEHIVCPARGVLRHENVTPLVGDSVEVVTDDAADEGAAAIERILPRKNSLVRPPVANLTNLFVVIPSAKPKPDLVTVDKLISICEEREIEPVVVVNKCDLDQDETARIKGIYEGAGFTCFALSAATGDGCGALLDYLYGEAERSPVRAAFAGVSAAGKSTLMKRLFPSLDLKTGDVSRKIERGRHTTRHVELFPVTDDGRCLIADTPGFSLLDFARFNFCSLAELPFTFREFADCLGKCKYTKCTHTKEEGCAVLEKMARGGISAERHRNYIALYDEIKQTPEWKRKRDADM